MASRPKLGPYPVITNGDMSTASITSKNTICDNISAISYDVSWSGTAPVGTLSVQISNTPVINGEGVISGGQWTEILSQAVSGNTGNGVFDVLITAAYAIRLVYTRTSGTGSLQATVHGKVS